MTHCDFSARSARHQWVRQRSEQVCRKKDKDHMEFLCELYETQVARGRYIVHELKSEAKPRMKCVTRIRG